MCDQGLVEVNLRSIFFLLSTVTLSLCFLMKQTKSVVDIINYSSKSFADI